MDKNGLGFDRQIIQLLNEHKNTLHTIVICMNGFIF